MHSEVLDAMHWDEQYQDGDVVWDTGDTGMPSNELRRVVRGHQIRPCRVLEVGFGTGDNAIWLAGLGFEVVAIDLSPIAIEEANRRARDAGVSVRFEIGDITTPNIYSERVDFFFDGGCYHAVRLATATVYSRGLLGHLKPNAIVLSN